MRSYVDEAVRRAVSWSPLEARKTGELIDTLELFVAKLKGVQVFSSSRPRSNRSHDMTDHAASTPPSPSILQGVLDRLTAEANQSPLALWLLGAFVVALHSLYLGQDGDAFIGGMLMASASLRKRRDRDLCTGLATTFRPEHLALCSWVSKAKLQVS